MKFLVIRHSCDSPNTGTETTPEIIESADLEHLVDSLFGNDGCSVEEYESFHNWDGGDSFEIWEINEDCSLGDPVFGQQIVN